MYSTSERVRAIALELQSLGVRLWLDERGAHLEPKEKLTAEMRAELRELKSEVIEYLVEQGEEILNDPDAVVLNNTPPRSAAETEKQRADAERERERARRRYQNGAVLINDNNSFGHYMHLLVRERERREAAERGTLPREGYYKTGWDLFNRREYE